MTNLTVFTVVDRTYEPFVLPYIASVLHHNPSARVEIGLENPLAFRRNNASALDLLNREFGPRFAFQQPDFGRSIPNTARFLATPRLAADYVYIGDADILVLEEIAPAHLDNMRRTGLPFSNIVRPGQDRLSGLHFSRWDAFYPIEVKPDYPLSHDEVTLYRMVQDRGFGMPDPSDTFRPLHGFHLSLNIDPRKTGGWGGTRSPAYTESYSAFRQSPLWQKLYPMLDARFRRLVFVLDVMLAARFPDVFKTMPQIDDAKAGFIFE